MRIMMSREDLGQRIPFGISMANVHADTLSAAPDSNTVSYSRIYAFGDSLSDVGNDYTLTLGLVPTPLIYSDGRFSNGAVWVQDLAADLKLPALKPSLKGGTNFAYGGAYAGAEPLHTVLPIDLPAQLAAFIAADPHPSANALYTLSIGGNDLLNAIPDYASNPTVVLADIQASVNDEISFLGSLALDGAKNFEVLNVPDLGKTPTEIQAGLVATSTYLSTVYNTELATGIAGLESADHVNVTVVDVFSLIDQAVADPAAFGFKNVTSPVWSGNYEDPLSGKLAAHGAAQNTYLFFDSLHPTSAGHTDIANLALSDLR